MQISRNWVLIVTLACAVGCAKPSPKQSGVPRPSVDESAGKRSTCSYTAGMKAEETLPASYPVGKDMPIEHIILMMNENRSFDHYFSALTGKDITVTSLTTTNPDRDGKPVSRFHLTSKCSGGGGHGWDDMHNYLNHGAMDGWVRVNGAGVMGYYDESDLPYYYALARTFAMSDMHFASVLGPTWPNRMFYFAATSWGLTGNDWAPQYDSDKNPYANILSELHDAGVSFRVYHDNVPTPGIIPGTLDYLDNFRNRKLFYTDVAAGDLAQVTFVEASDIGRTQEIIDEGPPGSLILGQNYTSGVFRTIMESPFWKTSVVFLTYDEAGGNHDSVVPPKACEPDDLAPILDPDPSKGRSYDAKFDQYGFRVPFFAVSPYAKRNFVSHVPRDHTAITRFIEAKFGLPAMTRRDANIDPPYDMFDFEHPDFSIPQLPVIDVDPADPTGCNLGP